MRKPRFHPARYQHRVRLDCYTYEQLNAMPLRCESDEWNRGYSQQRLRTVEAMSEAGFLPDIPSMDFRLTPTAAYIGGIYPAFFCSLISAKSTAIIVS